MRRFGVAVLGDAEEKEQTTISVQCAGTETSSCSATVIGGGGGGMHTTTLRDPFSQESITMHVYVDHSIVEVIINNQTAFAVTQVNPSSPNNTKIALLPTQGDVQGTAQVWSLRAARNG